MRILCVAFLALVLLPSAGSVSANAGSKGKYSDRYSGKRPSAHRGGARVKGFVARRGGYSYEANDVVNTYGDSRTRYGSMNAYRDPLSDRQSSSGPFDHGWFFDSGISPRGGDSPYMQ